MAAKAIIFDLDGTLIHSAPDLQFAINGALQALGRDPLDLATVISFIGNGVDVLVTRSLEATGANNPDLHRATLAQFLDIYGANMVTRTRPYPGVVAALAQFRTLGLPMAICTNKPSAPARGICDALDLSQYFDVVAGAEPGVAKKPDAAPLLAVATALDVAPAHVVYVGDSGVDYHTARNANIPFRLFNGGYLNDPLADLDLCHRFDDWDAPDIVSLILG